LTGNDKLRAEGKTDQAIGKVKQIAEKAVNKVKQAVKELGKRGWNGNRYSSGPKAAWFSPRGVKEHEY